MLRELIRENKIQIVIYGPFVIGLFCFYANYLYIKFDDEPKVTLPTPQYEVKFENCSKFCKVVKSNHCLEWVDISNRKLCQYVCDSFFELDNMEYSYEWSSVAKCAIQSDSAEELRRCKVSCTVMEEM